MTEPSITPKTAPLVSLVGAGPGDPDLLTLKAARLLAAAEVVIYDRLVSDEILALIPDTAEKIYVGKRRSDHALPQEQINQLLVDRGKTGARVVRLKGGDPFIFGRGSEEAEALAQAGIAFDVVPGITSASGCTAYAGIPLTHRGLARDVRFLPGYQRNGDAMDYDWDKIADPETTLVIYMGLTQLAPIAQRLIQAGLSPQTPVAAIENGTTPRQRRVVGTLDDIALLAEQAHLKPPTLIVVGKVVSLAGQVDWFTGA